MLNSLLQISLFLIFIGFILSKFGKNWKFYLIVNILMYVFFLYLWLTMLIPKEPTEHRGDTGLGFALFTIWFSPIFMLINLLSIFYAKKIKNEKILKINVIGLTICIINFIIFMIKTDFIKVYFG